MGYNVTWPNAEYHEILPNLYLGGHLWKENGELRYGHDSSVSGDPSWNYVVSAYIDHLSRACQPRCDSQLVLFDDTEDGLSEETWEKIRAAVDEIVSRWKQGQKVLVRCQAGYNRSGMIMSLVLIRLGLTADDAIFVLRRLRGQDVLINSAFERYVREREDEYHQPADLTVLTALLK